MGSGSDGGKFSLAAAPGTHTATGALHESGAPVGAGPVGVGTRVVLTGLVVLSIPAVVAPALGPGSVEDDLDPLATPTGTEPDLADGEPSDGMLDDDLTEAAKAHPRERW